ncbi:MAG TPA: hypothetical protein VNV82_13125 [Bryobacteraceae bacterium]|nr:hypothetical protein [Bryobacteraceae bacterium]
MSPEQASKECLVDGQLECVEKREMTKRGVGLSRIKLRRSDGYRVKLTVPTVQAAVIEIGGYYKIAILPDRAPDAPPKLNPGDRVIAWSRWGGLKVWRPAVLIGFTPGGQLAKIHDWTRRGSERKVKTSNLAPATDPFPSLDDSATILAGDAVLWRGKQVTVEGFVSSDQAVVNYPILVEDDGYSAYQSASKLVPLSQLMPLGPQEGAPSAPISQKG